MDSKSSSSETPLPAAPRRGYKLPSVKTDDTGSSIAAASTSSRASSQTPPLTNVLVNSIQSTHPLSPNPSNPPHTPHVSSTSRVRDGWGVGLAHSGSYLSTTVRTLSSLPLPREEPSTYDAIKNLLRKRKLWEIETIQVERVKQIKQQMQRAREKRRAKRERDQMMTINNNADLEEKVKSAKESKEIATSQAKLGREQLEKLMLRRSKIENEMRNGWPDKIDEFKKRSLEEENEEMKRLKEEHEREMDQMAEEYKRLNEKEKAQLAEMAELIDKIGKTDDSSVGQAPNEVVGVENTDIENKSTNDTEEKSREDNRDSNIGALEKAKNSTVDKEGVGKANHFQEEEESDVDKELIGDGNNSSDQKEVEVLMITKKKEKLKKMVDEVNDLNKTKSQMIWLLKQVITAEKKQEML